MAIIVSNKVKRPLKRKLFESESVSNTEESCSSDVDVESSCVQTSPTTLFKTHNASNQTPKRSTPLSERQQIALLRRLAANSGTSHDSSFSPTQTRYSQYCEEKKISGCHYWKRNERGETPLHIATIKGNFHGVKKLLRHGVDVNVRDFAGWTALHEACNHGWLDIAKLLIQFGADVSAEGFGKDTPLHDASINDHLEIVKLLLKYGADCKQRNAQWKTPLDVTRSEEVSSVLREALSGESGYQAVQANLASPGETPEDTDLWQSETSPCHATNNLCELTMRKNSPPNQTHKGADKPTSPRLTLRFQSIKSRDDKNSNITKINDLSSDEPKYQSYCVTMEAKGDVYDFQKDDGLIPSQNTSSLPETDACAPKLNCVGRDSPTKESKTADTEEQTDHGAVAAAAEGAEKMECDDAPSAKINGGRSSSDTASKDHDYVSDTEKEESRRKRRKSSDSSQNRLSVQNHTVLGRNHKSPSGKLQQHQDNSHNEQKNSPKGKKRGSLSSSDTESNPSDAEMPDIVVPDSMSSSHNGSGGTFAAGLHSPKVPPLKIVIPSGSSSLELETRERSKISCVSKTALPYVVNTSAESVDLVDGPPASNGEGPKDSSRVTDKSKDEANPPEERFQRVTRSSQRMQAAMSGVTPPSHNAETSLANIVPSGGQKNEQQSGESSTDEQAPLNTDIHPRKRKLRTRDNATTECNSSNIPPAPQPSPTAATASVSSGSPSNEDLQQQQQQPQQQQHQQLQQQQQQQQLLNSYQMYLNIRKQVGRRRKSMFVVHPKPPQGFKDYLLNRCSYVLEGNAASRLSVPMIPPPQSLEGSIKDLFVQQEKERYRLRLQHLIEREKLVLSAEQEILRVHGRAARAMVNQTVPLSVCSILKDEEIYNVLNVDQDDKDKNVRSRYNGRLFLSWLQDVDDKWEKIKEAMLLRHHNEAESLHAVQKLDWEWKMKELAMCDMKATPVIDDISVPIVHVSDDFDLLPA